MALFVSGELISVLCFVCEFEADRIFVARDYFEVLGQNTSVFCPCTIIPPSLEGIFGI